jgi:hypothetical protein
MFKVVLDSKNSSELIYNIGVTFLIIILSSFILRWLWNRALVPHITTIKPIRSLLDAFLMSIAIAVIRGN